MSGANAQVRVSDSIPQYLFSDFATGAVVKSNGEKIAASLNYNVITEEMIFRENGRYMALSGIDEIDSVYLNNMVFIPAGKAFYELAVDGPVKLFVQFSGTVRVEGEEVGYGSTSQTSRVRSLNTLISSGAMYSMDLPENLVMSRHITYYVEKNGKRKRFVNERAFLRNFRDYREALEEYIERSNIRFDRYNDVVKLVQFLNGIYGER
ncbi:MAG: hypothetical protein ACP5D1_07735 [Bacteroidales bacterium]